MFSFIRASMVMVSLHNNRPLRQGGRVCSWVALMTDFLLSCYAKCFQNHKHQSGEATLLVGYKLYFSMFSDISKCPHQYALLSGCGKPAIALALKNRTRGPFWPTALLGVTHSWYWKIHLVTTDGWFGDSVPTQPN